jgi:hypothetical protein
VVQRLLSCNPVLFGLALAGIWKTWRDRRIDPRFWMLSLFLILTDLVTVGFLSCVEPSIRLYLPVMPLVLLLALRGLDSRPRIHESANPEPAARSSRGARILLTLVTLGALAYPLRYGLQIKEEPWPILPPASIQEIHRNLPRDSIFLSDCPDYLSSVLNRPAVFLPTLSTVDRTLQRWDRPVWLHLSPGAPEFLENEGEIWEEWEKWMERKGVAESSHPVLVPQGHRLMRVR